MADFVPYSQAATTSLVSTLQNSDLMALAREDNDSDTGYQSKVTRVDTIAKKVVKETDYSDLQTTSKNPIGAINEVNTKASQFDNMTATASGSIATFDNGGDDIPVSEFECDIVAQQASGTPTPDNPLPITGFSQADITVTDNDQIANLYTVSFGQTIYGGRLIYANGQWSIEATHGGILIDGASETFTGVWGSNTNGYVVYKTVADITNRASSFSNEFTYQYTTWQNMNLYKHGGSSGASTTVSFCLPDTVTSLEAANTWASNNNVQLAYELATPVIIPLSSTVKIKTLPGINNIFSNTGNCELKYFTNKADSLAELIKAFVL